MYRNQYQIVAQSQENTTFRTPENNGYNSRQVTNIVKRYRELRSAVEIASVRFERTGGNGPRTGKEEILCALVDIDQGMSHLSRRQRAVVQMLTQGYPYEDICSRLGVCMATTKFHARQGIFRLTTYLNSH